jgi:hypothetical protein
MSDFCAESQGIAQLSAEGWQLLSQDSAASQWRTSNGTLPAPGWRIEGSCLKLIDPLAAESLHTAKHFRNFELQWEWEIGHGGNSGVKYLAQPANPTLSIPWQIRGSATAIFLAAVVVLWLGRRRYPRLARAASLALLAISLFGFGLSFKVDQEIGNSWRNPAIGFEYQMLDDAHNPEGLRPKFRSGELYGILPRQSASATLLNTSSVQHSSRIRVQNQRVEHWLDDQLVLAFTLDSSQFQSALRDSKFAGNPHFLSPDPGVIHLQNHQSRVTFRNMRIRVLAPNP